MSDLPPVFGSEGEAALTGLLQHVGDVLTVLDLDHLDRLSGDQLLTQMSQVAHVLRGSEAALAAMSAEVAVRSDPTRGGEGLAAKHTYQRPSQLIEVITGLSSATAGRLIRVGQRTTQRVSDAGLPLPPLFPVVSKALHEGLIGVEAAENITRELSLAAPRAEVEHLAIAETALVEQATGAGWRDGLPLSADLIAIQARQWRERLDEDGIEPRTEKAFQKRNFWISRTATDGLIKFGGLVTVDVGAKLHALLDAILSPRTDSRYEPTGEAPGVAPGTSSGDHSQTLHAPRGAPSAYDAARRIGVPDRRTNPGEEALTGSVDGEEGARLVDRRTAGQKRADVFAAMIDSLARGTDAPTVTGASPTVVVTVTADVLDSGKGTGQIIGVNTPVSMSIIKQILSDASMIPVFIDPDGKVVALGNDQRGFSRIQRMGMIARDGPTCAMPGCQIPATGCEAHHVVEYSEGGPTHLDNGALFCWFHHRMIKTGVFTVEMVNGKPEVTIAEWLRRKPYFQ
ncbi:HNH endonuclease signature motif containing protein [Mycetocola zhadangensis]|uniref:HNH endonuclease signature motif containing protein n=1 Tax=Mycetocola zhadangensis TaxID=1164595 RepID=UPI0016020529|nr:HNH endonuclease signature motif containing protein [Mycetocola zhadangensis]